MGQEITIYALPDDNNLFRLAAISEEHGQAAQFLHLYYSGRNRRNADGSEIDKLFYAEAQGLKSKHPGIDRRICYLDRYWDKLHFLLSEDRRNGSRYSTDYGTIAIFGEHDIHKNAIATQGAHLRYVTAAAVAYIALWLNGISSTELKANYKPELMEGTVYKFWKDKAGEQELNLICEHFDRLKNFYQSIAEHEEGGLVVLD